MSSVEKTIKIVKRNAREPFIDQTQGLLKTDKQSKREMAKAVASWIEERRQISKKAVFRRSIGSTLRRDERFTP